MSFSKTKLARAALVLLVLRQLLIFLHCSVFPLMCFSLSTPKWLLGLGLNGVPGNAWLSGLEEHRELSL
ncbi:hypothetical protein E2C01_099490 [Portunus trituberculatus]|uniref:Uncharacterized protein n=1 Tax=Portunus trituberculatus TaxID=210409 RepID=A0A5B7KGZ5_PORTR|nr:hypothetical protein [Portunus trituberculatus]